MQLHLVLVTLLGIAALSSVQANPTHDRSTSSCTSQTRACQNFNPAVKRLIDNQIKMELEASYTYMAMASHFGRDDIAYRGFAKFFNQASLEEREHAQKLIDYSLERGGNPSFQNIEAGAVAEWTPLNAVKEALKLERNVNSALLDLHGSADNDPHLQNFLETHYLTEQVESIKQLADWRSVLHRLENSPASSALGIHTFSEELFHGKR